MPESHRKSKQNGQASDEHTCLDKKTEKSNEIGLMLVPGVLNWTKNVRKACADMFAKVGLEKP